MPRWGFWARFKAQWKRDLRAAKKQRMPWWAILGGIGFGALLSFLVDHFMGPAFVAPDLVALTSLAYVVWFKRALKREMWFRVVMGLMIMLHGVALVWIPWTYRDLPGRAVGGAFALDACVMLVVVNAVGVFVAGRDAASNGGTLRSR